MRLSPPLLASMPILLLCLALTACTASGPKGPDSNVTVPAVGKPPAPTSADAALSSEAFTPYAGLGAVSNDLAPGVTYRALHTACMNAAGYGQYAADVPFAIRANRGLALPQPAGPWGYVNVSLAQQYGFQTPDGEPDISPGSFSSLPMAVQEAGNKCSNIVLDFNNHEFATSLAGIETMNNEISTDVIQDAEFKKATTAWSKCMARNGYTTADADTFALGQRQALIATPRPKPGLNATPAPDNQAQIAMAVTDAQCTLDSDLAGIYFAVQTDYEQQFVTANQQALNVAVRRYKADYAKELSRLPALLRTASGKPGLTGPSRRVQGKPSPTPSPSAS